MPPDTRDDTSILGGRTLRTPEKKPRVAVDGPPDAFRLFSAYYLGVTLDDGYQKQNIEEIARRHSITPEKVKELLVEYNIEPDKVRSSSFDLEGAQMDIRVAPQGISRTEIARDAYQEYLDIVDG